MDRHSVDPIAREEARAARMLMLPALSVIALVAVFPLAWAGWESLHSNDLRMPWRGRPYVGLANYREAISDPRFGHAFSNTLLFTVVTVSCELLLGLTLALLLNRSRYGRGIVRTAVLLPWALPAVVAGLLWAFLFDSQAGIVNAILQGVGVANSEAPISWFTGPVTAWIPIMLADIWKTTPFVALLLLAGLQGIDLALYEAAAIDGASRFKQLIHITLPLLMPAFVVVAIFRTVDAFRVFDLIFVLTRGGPGTSTEPLAMYAFTTLLNYLRFGYGSALSVLVFLITFLLALAFLAAAAARNRRPR